ncbi:MAG: M36 family metallopeptidase [Pyrinomonadaceae bacterium]
MKRNAGNSRDKLKTLTIIAVFWAIVATAFYLPFRATEAAPNQAPSAQSSGLYKRLVPNADFNKTRALANQRAASSVQISALDALKADTNASNMTSRWNDFSGSPDVIYDFASEAFSGTPEEAGRAFIAQNAALFGVADINNLRLLSNKQALGGYLLRFQQTFGGIDVIDGGIGIVMNGNRQVVMASGPFFRDVAVNTQPNITAQTARQAATADLQRFKINLPANINNLIQPALNMLGEKMSGVGNLEPRLGIYPTADGFKLVWKVATYSTNPFGLFLTQIDAHTGEIVSRKDFINFQAQSVLPYTADVYPKYPRITDALKDQSIIAVCGSAPCDQERVTLRSFDQQNIVSGLNGVLTGTHAAVYNALPTKQPFVQAAKGTWHFQKDDATNFEARTNEIDQFSEPAEHQDEINAFFFVTYLLEYVDYLHVAGDRQTAGGSEGDFPNTYPNKTIPLPAIVHIPNAYLALNVVLKNSVPDPQDPNLVYKALGMDNAFAANVTGIYQSLQGEPAPDGVVNPTTYGHGFLLNDLALEGTVPYHEGMHAITSPIAGLEGGDEASALNEGQADMWAFTITDNPSLGDYVVNAKGYRDRFRSRGMNPDSIQYIRSARSTLKYSDIGTLYYAAAPELVPLVLPATPERYDFEEHYDGEIYMSTMWDVREMMNRVYPQASTYKRPRPKDGQALKAISKGTEIFERDFLGAMYVLGTTAPDTMVKSRDALLVADQLLYPSDATDPDSPGKHRAMIEQIFAAKELGVNAREVDAGGQATISTQVTPFTGEQIAPAVPQNVQVNSAGSRALRISWDGVSGAISYQILKRKIGFENARQPNGKREFIDGDSSTTGFKHVAFIDGNQVSYTDEGAVHEVFAPEGLNDLFDSEYVVRAIGVNSTGQLGWSNFSGGSRAVKAEQDLTQQIDSTISNITFTNGVMAFDNKLTNARGAFSADRTAYGPVKFQITSISSPTVTVKNADQNGNAFLYNQTLPFGAVSNAKRIEFNDASAQLFTFDAKITASAFFGATDGGGSQNPDGTSLPPQPVVYSVFRETKTGNLVGGEPSSYITGAPSPTYGDPQFKGITWDDIEVVTKSDAQFLDATLSASLARDLDFELRTEDGQVIADSAGETADEHFFVAVQPNTRYFFRVKGFINGPVQYTIVSDQLLPDGSPNENAGKRTIGGNGAANGGSGGGVTGAITRALRFTVNPLTRKVTVSLLR